MKSGDVVRLVEDPGFTWQVEIGGIIDTYRAKVGQLFRLKEPCSDTYIDVESLDKKMIIRGVNKIKFQKL